MTTVNEIEIISNEEIEQIKNMTANIFNQSRQIEIKNKEDFESTALRLQFIKTKSKKIEERRKELIKPFQDATKKLNAFFQEPLRILTQAENYFKKALSDFIQKQENERREQQNKIDELAEKERQRLIKQAEKQKQKGHIEKAQEIIQKTELINHVVVEKDIPIIKGIQERENWTYRIIDIAKVPREYLILDEKRINKIAKASKGLVKIDGIEFYSERIIASSAL